MQKINERIAEVQDMISSQEKLIQSAHGLLRVTADTEKRALLSASLGSREGNLEKLHRELQELQGKCGRGGVGGGAEVEDGLVGSFRMKRLKCIFIAFFKALLYVNIKNCFIIELTGASVLHSCTVGSRYTYV